MALPPSGGRWLPGPGESLFDSILNDGLTVKSSEGVLKPQAVKLRKENLESISNSR